MKLLYPEDQIKQEVDRVASEIVDHYQGQRVLMIGVLTGAYIFKADLVRAISREADRRNVEVTQVDDFTTASSYFHGRRSSGETRIVYDINVSPKDENILLIDDIWDTGGTSRTIHDIYRLRRAKSVEVAVLIRRIADNILAEPQNAVPSLLKTPPLTDPRFVCFNHRGKEFFVGYGLDDKGIKRDKPQIYGLEAHEM